MPVTTHDTSTESEMVAGDGIPTLVAPRNQVPSDVRQFVAARHLARPDNRWAIVRTLEMLAGWVALVALGLIADHWLVWLAVWAALAVWFSTFLPYVHHAVHRNLFSSRAANDVLGCIVGVLAFMHAPGYRSFHLTHHVFTKVEGDPESLPATYSSRLHYLGYYLVTGPGLGALTWLGAVSTLVGRPPEWVRTKALRRHQNRWFAVPVLVVAGLVALALVAPRLVLFGWLVPSLLSSVVVVPYLTLADHLGAPLDRPQLECSRTTVSHAFVRWLYLNDNYHAAHHLVPAVPPRRLPELDAVVRSRTTFVSPSFTRVQRDALRGLPWH